VTDILHKLMTQKSKPTKGRRMHVQEKGVY